jgi:hypothetical protein
MRIKGSGQGSPAAALHGGSTQSTIGRCLGFLAGEAGLGCRRVPAADLALQLDQLAPHACGKLLGGE